MSARAVYIRKTVDSCLGLLSFISSQLGNSHNEDQHGTGLYAKVGDVRGNAILFKIVKLVAISATTGSATIVKLFSLERT